MTDVAEPPILSLQARIAALNQQSGGKSLNPNPNPTAAKRPPPPPPPTNRPSLPTRNTVNNPPIATYGSSVTKQANNLPIGARGQALLPPPSVDRDQAIPATNARTPPLPARNGPPALPTRKASAPSPALPARNSSTQLVPTTQWGDRRGSNASTMSHSSTVSGLSLGQGSSISSVESTRKLPPMLGEGKLPPLPPSKRELEEKARIANAEKKDLEDRAKAARADAPPLVSTRSAPIVPMRPPPAVERDAAPKMPARPSIPPRMPSRPMIRNNIQTPEAVPPPQLARRLPPVAARKSILDMGFGNKPTEPRPATQAQNTESPFSAPRPAPTKARPSSVVQELSARDFNSSIEGKYALVDFYAPYCKYCVELDPILKKLAEAFSFASDKLIIAKVDVDKHKSFMDTYDIEGYPTIMLFEPGNPTPEKYQYSRKLGAMTDFIEEKTGINVADAAMAKPSGVPPPINMSSKPSANEVRAVQSRPAPTAPPSSGCLRCRDFSAPDAVAAKYPRETLPKSYDLSGYLADVLCTPFASATDKARAIFSWLHHNVAYDVDAFFGNRVKHVEPRDTITTGLAVCGGYAGLYAAIALKAGLEAVMVTGHGKGHGHSALKPGESAPPRSPSGHAWNAVRIDGGEWKLLDPCWGAGNLKDNSYYNKDFTPSQFTMSNENFGLKHFPQDDKYFFRKDGSIPTWEEYIIGPCAEETVQVYGDAERNNGIDVYSILPLPKRISTRGNPNDVIRFQFSKICEHWNHEVNGLGKPYVIILKIGGVDGRKEDFVPFETNGFWWWLDVERKDLGAAGQALPLYSVVTIDGKDARGMTNKEYLKKKGRCGYSFGGVACWDLV